MTEFKSGQTVYDVNAKAFEYHHTHAGVHYCYPVFEFDGPNEEWFEIPGDNLVGLATIYAQAPKEKLEEKATELTRQIDDLRVEAAKARADARVAAEEQRRDEQSLERWRNQYGHIRKIGKLMDGETLFFLTLPNYKWHIPVGKSEKDAITLHLRYDSKKGYIWVKPDSYHSDRSVYLGIYETLEELHDEVAKRFDICVVELRRQVLSQTTDLSRARSPYNPINSHHVPHINKLRDWVKAWPHLEIPQDVLDGEVEWIAAKKASEIAHAKQRLKELSDG